MLGLFYEIGKQYNAILSVLTYYLQKILIKWNNYEIKTKMEKPLLENQFVSDTWREKIGMRSY